MTDENKVKCRICKYTFHKPKMNKRYIKTIKQARRIKKIDNVIFEGHIIKEIVDKLKELEK